ncbi:penicillin-binding protein 2 [Actinomycetaceae bacterium TAE3-ERU4]|nr:penicillin-binding protein 2 [Actinomycetaceae bacterium TAE3-ERU4]
MNPQIRKLMGALALMLLSLFVAASYIQYWRAPALVADARNARPIYESWKRDRGPIIVAGKEIALSKKVEGNVQYQREYPLGPEYASITGYAAVKLHVYSGLEAAASADLDGTSNSLWTQRIQDLLTGSQPRGGALILTIDPKMQKAAYDSLQGRTGAAVVIDRGTGEIKALVSTPTFNPNDIVQANAKKGRKDLSELQDDPRRPLTNRVISGDRYPPGSVFKIIVAATALERGIVNLDSVVEAPRELKLPGTNHTIKNYGGEACGNGHPKFSFAFAHSCNTPFAKLGMDLGWDALSAQAKKFGFETDISIPMMVTPSVFPQTDGKAQLAQASIGQLNVQITPLEAAMVSAAVANDGKLMKPFLIESTANRDLVVQKTTEPQMISQAVSPEVAKKLRSLMTDVVVEGTGKPASIKGIQVAGKTGTAETGRNGSHAWFTGFAPADNPKYAIAVVLEAGNGEYLTGGPDAGPIAARILKAGLQ